MCLIFWESYAVRPTNITNSRLASAFISAFCTTKLSDIEIKAWGEY